MRARLVSLTIAASALVGKTAVVPAQATACITSNPVLQSDLTARADYTTCDYRGVYFNNVSATTANGLAPIDFSIAHLENSHFEQATFTGANFRSATAQGSVMIGANMSG